MFIQKTRLSIYKHQNNVRGSVWVLNESFIHWNSPGMKKYVNKLICDFFKYDSASA